MRQLLCVLLAACWLSACEQHAVTEGTQVNDSVKVSAEQYFDSLYNFSRLNPDIRLRSFIDTILAHNRTVLVVYSTRCQMNNCCPKGFVCYSNDEGSHLVLFNKKWLHQRIPGTDSAVFIGAQFQFVHYEGELKDRIASHLEGTVDELSQKRIPKAAGENREQQEPLSIMYCRDTFKGEQVALTSMFAGTDAQQWTTTGLIVPADSLLKAVFSRHRDTLSFDL